MTNKETQGHGTELQATTTDEQTHKYTGKQDNKGVWLIRNTWEQ